MITLNSAIIRKIVIALIGVIALLFSFLYYLYSNLDLDAKPRVLPNYKLSTWNPEGIPNATKSSKITPDLITGNSMHLGINNNDQLMIATAPKQTLDWVAETQFYIPEGPTLDKNGHIYFSPYQPQEDVSLVSLDGKTGERRWTVPAYGDTNGSGAILILNDPESNQQIIYHATYSDIYALSTEGKIIWQAKTTFSFKGEGKNPHTWGVNYLPGIDALSVLSEDGKLMLFSRVDGKALLTENYELPGSPASNDYIDKPSDFISGLADKAGEEVFGKTPKGQGLFSTISMIIFGGGKEVTNFYGSDPNRTRLYIAATAPDEIDGKKDGVSSLGAIYAIDFSKKDAGSFQPIISARFDFEGGTGATPSISNDGKWVFASDENGNLIALDSELNEVWRINVGSQIAASVAVSSDNNELYAITARSIHKIINKGSSAEIAWNANLSMYPGFNTINALTAVITANGIAVSLGATPSFAGDVPLLIDNGFGLLDKNTGEVISFTEGFEESIAVTMLAPDGAFVIGSSPTRRLLAKGLFGDKIKKIQGGVARYKSTDDTLLARDAVCMAERFKVRQSGYNQTEHPAAFEWDSKQISILIEQAENALGNKINHLETECKRLNSLISTR
jgi:hypothetical protein